ncbi:MAG TPA: arylesterase [Thermohalobaculum sp.]|nr:arylesterase [Thermohalobaculum sp.]
MPPALLRNPVSYGLLGRLCNPAWLLVLLTFAGIARAEAPLRILAIGDSLTHGYGLEQGDGLVPQLQRWLQENGAPPVDVINMGVSGDTTAGGRARLGWALGDGGDAVILELGANDMLRGTDPGETRANLAAMMAELAQRGLPVLLVGMRAATNYGPEYQAAFDAIYPEIAGRHGALLYPWFFAGIAGDPAMFQADGLHPSAAGIDAVVSRMGPLVLELIEKARQ